MSKLSPRLFALTGYVEKGDSIVDVGCDHGLLSIYLYENELCKNIIASDINEKALQNAIENISKRQLNIKTVLSDGICNVELEGINALIISGMGTGTILHILENRNRLTHINKLIIQSNNDHQLLRNELNKKGYYLQSETVTNDKNKWYVTCLFIKSSKKNSKKEIKYGYLNNLEYVKYLYDFNKKIYKKIPINNLLKKIEYIKLLKVLKKAIKK